MSDISDSITYLVRKIANEVFDTKIKDHELTRRRIYEIDLRDTENRICEGIKSSLEKAGRPWHTPEDGLLTQEVNTAIAQIAKNHSRSSNAIAIRIVEKGLIRS